MIVLIQLAAMAGVAGQMPATMSSTSSTMAVPAAMQAFPMVGGFRAVDVSDETVQQVAAFVAEEMSIEFAEIVSAHRQTVQGANYRLVLLDTEGNRWQVEVSQSLQGELQVTSRQQI